MNYNIVKEEKRILDDNGVIVGREENVKSVYTKKNEEDEYFKIYFQSVDWLLKLPHTAIVLLLELSKRMTYANIKNKEEYGGQIVSVRKNIREQICKEIGIQDRTFHKHMKILKDNNLIREVSLAVYQINPSIIGRGFYYYKNDRDSGGISDLRIAYSAGNFAIVDVEDNAQLIGIIEQEIELLVQEYKNEKVPADKEYLLNQIKKYNEEIMLLKLHPKKTVKYHNSLLEIRDSIHLLLDEYTDL